MKLEKRIKGAYWKKRIKQRGYGITKRQLSREIALHKEAKETGDNYMMQEIESYMIDINFHHECGLIRAGRYKEALEQLD